MTRTLSRREHSQSTLPCSNKDVPSWFRTRHVAKRTDGSEQQPLTRDSRKLIYKRTPYPIRPFMIHWLLLCIWNVRPAMLLRIAKRTLPPFITFFSSSLPLLFFGSDAAGVTDIISWRHGSQKRQQVAIIPMATWKRKERMRNLAFDCPIDRYHACAHCDEEALYSQ